MELAIEMLKQTRRLFSNHGRYYRPNPLYYSITHSFIIHKRFKHADADITDKGNEKTPADLWIQPVTDPAKDRTLLWFDRIIR